MMVVDGNVCVGIWKGIYHDYQLWWFSNFSQKKWRILKNLQNNLKSYTLIQAMPEIYSLTHCAGVWSALLNTIQYYSAPLAGGKYLWIRSSPCDSTCSYSNPETSSVATPTLKSSPAAKFVPEGISCAGFDLWWPREQTAIQRCRGSQEQMTLVHSVHTPYT